MEFFFNPVNSDRFWPWPMASVWPLGTTWAMNNNTDYECGRYMDTEIVLGSRLGSDTMVPGGSTGPSDWHGPETPTWPQEGTQSPGIGLAFMISGTTEINTDPTVGGGCSRAIDPDKFLDSSPVLDDTMAPGNSADPSNCYGPSCSTALWNQHGHRLWPRPWMSIWPLVATWAARHQYKPQLWTNGYDQVSFVCQLIIMEHKKKVPNLCLLKNVTVSWYRYLWFLFLWTLFQSLLWADRRTRVLKPCPAALKD